MREIFSEDFTKCQGPFIGHQAIQRVVNRDNLWSVYRPLTSFLARRFSHMFLLLTILRMMMIILMIIVMMIEMIVMRWWWLRWWWWWSIFYIHLIAASHYSISVTCFIPWIFTVKRTSIVIFKTILDQCTLHKINFTKKSSNLTSHFKTIGNSYYHYIITYSSWFSH